LKPIRLISAASAVVGEEDLCHATQYARRVKDFFNMIARHFWGH